MDVLPAGWVKTCLGDVCHFINGRAFKVTEWSDSGLPIIRIQNLNNAQAKYNYFLGPVDERHRVSSGDLLFAWSGTPGTSFGAHVWRGENAVLNQHIFKVIIDETVVMPEFMELVIKHNLSSIIDKAQGGVGLRHITRKDLESIEIAFPCIKIQKRILERLKNVQARINATRAELDPCIAQTHQYKTVTLGSIYSRGIANAPAPLSEVVTDIRYGTSKKSYPNSKGTPVLRIPNIVGGEISTKELKYTELDDAALKNLSLQAGDILIVRSNGSVDLVGRTAVVSQAHIDMVYAGYLIRIRPDLTKVSPPYLNCMLQSPQVREQIESAARSTSGVNNINATELMNLLIPCPPITDQEAAVGEFLKADKKASSLRAELNKVLELLPNLESEVMNKIFSGDFVLDDSDAADITHLSNAVSGSKLRLAEKLRDMRSNKEVGAGPTKTNKPTAGKSIDQESAATNSYLVLKLKELGGQAKAKDLWMTSGMDIEDFYKLLRADILIETIVVGREKDILEINDEA